MSRSTTTRSRRSALRTASVVAVVGLTTLGLAACGSSASGAPAASGSAPATSSSTVATAKSALGADQWVANAGAYKEAANWDTATVISLDLGKALAPASLELKAGAPYEIQIRNSGAADQGISAPDLFRASAVRKTESGAEIKMHQFSAIYAVAGKTVSLFVVPVIPGTYPLVGVSATGTPVAGLEGKVTITGAVPTAPAPDIKPLTSLGAPADAKTMLAAAIPTWATAATAVKITMGDNGPTGFYKPKDTALKVGVPATITFVNEGAVLHVFECGDFLKTAATWKVTGPDGWNTGAQARPADVEAGKTTSLYVIPTVAGTYQVTDSTPGFESMTTTITVTK